MGGAKKRVVSPSQSGEGDPAKCGGGGGHQLGVQQAPIKNAAVTPLPPARGGVGGGGGWARRMIRSSPQCTTARPCFRTPYLIHRVSNPNGMAARGRRHKTMSNTAGIKLPTEHDWLEPDSVWQNFVRLIPGTLSYVQYDHLTWLREVRKFRITDAAPPEIRNLFEVARSAIIYGYLCYPLLTLGTEQLHRVLEAAVRLRAKELGWAPKVVRDRHRNDLPDYRKGLAFLKEVGVISSEDGSWWDIARWLRNYASHPAMQTIHPPSMALSTLESTSDRINELLGA